MKYIIEIEAEDTPLSESEKMDIKSKIEDMGMRVNSIEEAPTHS